jgi:hypothetical protein
MVGLRPVVSMVGLRPHVAAVALAPVLAVVGSTRLLAEVKNASIKLALQKVLDELCVELGCCLDPAENARPRRDPPEGVDAFVDAVVRSEGIDPMYIDTDLKRLLQAVRRGRIL